MILKSERNETKWFDKFLQDKKNLNIIRAILIIGIVLLSIGSFMPKSEKTTESKKAEVTIDDLEQKIEATISEIVGVGKTKVLITYKTKGEIIPATDVSESKTSEENRSVEDKEEKIVLANSGSAQAPVIVKEFSPQVQGIVVVAEGGENPKTKQDIIEAITALCDVSPHNIGVFAKKTSK